MITHDFHTFLPFNTPLESALRSLVVLTEAFPSLYDLQRLVFFDYLIVHSADAPNGPKSLHPGTPHRSGEVLVRRVIVEDGLTFLLDRGLIERRFDSKGILYGATDYAAPFLDCLRAPYTRELKERGAWVVRTFGAYSDEALTAFFSANLDRWGSEFERESLVRGLPQ